MVQFYERYSDSDFVECLRRYGFDAIVQSETAQLSWIAASGHKFVQSETAQMPKILTLTSFTNHIAILSSCKSADEILFYILYANKERLRNKELIRCIENGTYSSLLGGKQHLSTGLKEQYAGQPMLFKDTAFLDFLNLPKRHNEKQLHRGILEHMK